MTQFPVVSGAEFLKAVRAGVRDAFRERLAGADLLEVMKSEASRSTNESVPHLTAKHRAFLLFLMQSMARQGYMPTYREVQLHFGWNAPAAASSNVGALVKKGILRQTGQCRGLLFCHVTWIKASHNERALEPVFDESPTGRMLKQLWDQEVL